MKCVAAGRVAATAVLLFAFASMAAASEGQSPPPSGSRPQADVAAPPEATKAAAVDAARAETTAAPSQTKVAALSLATAASNEIALPPPPPRISLVLKVDLSAQRLSVVEGGKVKGVWPISSGREGFTTQTGTFRPQWASKMWYSRQYEMAPMPHAVFFNGGTAFHATNAVGQLGRPASHGCIRLAPGHAAHLYKLIHRHGYASTKVVVHRTSRDPLIARGKSKRRNNLVADATAQRGSASARKVAGMPNGYATGSPRRGYRPNGRGANW